jgi:MSHA biogenesis protein MshJ
MKERLQAWAETIDGLALRERALVLLGAVAVVFLLFDGLLLQPVSARQERIKDSITDLNLKLAVLEQSSLALVSDPDTDAAGRLTTRREDLRGEIAALGDQFRDQLGALMSPDQASQVLKDVLAQEGGLRLRALRSEVTGLDGLENAATPSGRDPSGIGRYQITLEMEGSYLATLRYLRALEALPWRLFWERLDVEVQDHPRAQISLQVYTLGAVNG